MTTAAIISTIIGITLLLVFYITGYTLMYKAKNDTALLIGLITVFLAIGIGIITVVVGRSLREDESSSQDSSQTEEICSLTHFEDIPDYIEGCAITDTTNRRFYVTRMSDKEDNSSEECDNINSISDDTRSEDSSGL